MLSYHLQRLVRMPAQIITAMGKPEYKNDQALQLELVSCFKDEGVANMREYCDKQRARGTYGSAAEMRVAQKELQRRFTVYEQRELVTALALVVARSSCF